MARPQSFPVRLTQEQRESLEQTRGQALPRKQQYRREILLRADEGDTDQEIADDLDVHADTVRRVRRRFVEHGLEAALADRPRPGAPPKLDGKREAMVIALACTDAPEGATAGASACWPAAPSSSRSSRPSPARRSGGSSKTS